MKRGAWHQCGDKSQKLVLEQLKNGTGVGVVLSPRDISLNSAIRYANLYHRLKAEVVIDQQFYVPSFINSNLETYPISNNRLSISRFERVTESNLAEIRNHLRTINADLHADAVIAPALAYEAARLDIVSINSKLFSIAKEVGKELGIPTYATAMIGHSATSSEKVMADVLSNITSLEADGWYFGFEYIQERIPSSYEFVMRCCTAGLTLACTGLPVLHAFAGPSSILSFGFGATGAGVGHFQNLWQFSRSRWTTTSGKGGGGGGGDAPPRFFSSALWGTIIFPDEFVRLPESIKSQIITQSPYCHPVTARATSGWNRWDSNKHLVHCISHTLAMIGNRNDARKCADSAITILQNALNLHSEIAAKGIKLRDNTCAYQDNWVKVLQTLLKDHSSDFDYLALL